MTAAASSAILQRLQRVGAHDAGLRSESSTSAVAGVSGGGALRVLGGLSPLRAHVNDVDDSGASNRNSGSSGSSGSAKKPKLVCPVCGGPGRDTTSRVCGLCYNGVYNDIKKYLKREAELVPRVLVDIGRFIQELQVMPRGCEKDYTCTQADYAFELPQYEKCTRCRSLAVSRAAPDLVTQMIRKGLEKERKRREKEAAVFSSSRTGEN